MGVGSTTALGAERFMVANPGFDPTALQARARQAPTQAMRGTVIAGRGWRPSRSTGSGGQRLQHPFAGRGQRRDPGRPQRGRGGEQQEGRLGGDGAADEGEETEAGPTRPVQAGARRAGRPRQSKERDAAEEEDEDMS